MEIRGWVYVISNRAMPGLVKVGFSLKDPQLRADELNHTGIPHPYVVEYEALVPSPQQIEQKAHAKLGTFHERKEWFRCDIFDAIQAIRQVSQGSILVESLVSIDAEIEFYSKDSNSIKEERLIAIAKMLNLPEDLYYTLAWDCPYKDVLIALAGNPHCPPDTLDHILNDHLRPILEWGKASTTYAPIVAANPNTTTELLVKIVESEWDNDGLFYSVLTTVANNPSCTREVIQSIQKVDDVWYEHEGLCDAFARNDATDDHTLGMIVWVNSGKPSSDAALKNKNWTGESFKDILNEWASMHDPDDRAAVPMHPHCPPDLLSVMAKDESLLVRYYVAIHPKTPSNDLTYLGSLLGSKEIESLDAAASEILFDSTEDESDISLPVVVRAARANPSSPFSKANDFFTSQVELIQLSNSSSNELREPAQRQQRSTECNPYPDVLGNRGVDVGGGHTAPAITARIDPSSMRVDPPMRNALRRPALMSRQIDATLRLRRMLATLT